MNPIAADRFEKKKTCKTDETSGRKMSEAQSPAVLVSGDRRRFGLSRLPRLPLVPLFLSKTHSIISAVTLSTLKCNIPLKVTAVKNTRNRTSPATVTSHGHVRRPMSRNQWASASFVTCDL